MKFLLPQLWPAFILGVLVAAYWARVVRLVIKTRRKAGHGANFVPPELLGRLLRIVWYPVVGLWIVVPLVTAYQKKMPAILQFAYRSGTAGWIAVIVGVLAFVATLVCWKKMGKSWRMGIDPAEKTQLIVQGPYAYVRHPIYALSSLLMLATLVAVPSVLMMLVAGIHLLFLQWEARREEKYLVSQHGDAYANYQTRVGRFMPKSLVGFNREI